ncbi:hypothetical protein VTJ49DRAFT_4016 [Mycothermus thermophilus]|uniref:BRCT domain-containing protein n=1 Tax=Humicola insolens TaxID=85995 RepID=A0ABR3VLT0_HUMIN
MAPLRTTKSKAKPIFRNLVIAGLGDLNNRPDGSGQWTDANIARWVALRDGVFVRPGVGVVSFDEDGAEDGKDGGKGGKNSGGGGGGGGGNKGGNGGIGEDVTHVVCSKEEFRRMGRLVQEVLKRKSIEIVTLDWLEDSMIGHKRLPTDRYSHRRALERERQKERMRQRYEKGIEKGVKEINPNLYHLYRDDTFFQYEVTITREDEELGIPGERYVLSLWESNNSSPHMYWFVAKFYKKKGDSQPKIHRPSIAPGMLSREFALFEPFFQLKTGIPWMQRLIKVGTMPKNYFQYQPPTGGKPVGYVPPEFVPAESPEPAIQPAISTTAEAEPDTTENRTIIPVTPGLLHVSPTTITEDGTKGPVHAHEVIVPKPPMITPAASPRNDDDNDATVPADTPQEQQHLDHEEAGLSSDEQYNKPMDPVLPLTPD